MRDFRCPNCGQRLAFENSACLNCGVRVGFDPELLEFRAVDTDGAAIDGSPLHMCANVVTAWCNWVAPARVGVGLCRSCSLTRTRPADGDTVGLPEFAAAESAKRRLVVELIELGLPIVGRRVDRARGLCFDLLSSERVKVMTGHADGVITLDLAESNDAHREQLRISMDEPYRTLLGHFRHEIGHYYYQVLVERASDNPAEHDDASAVPRPSAAAIRAEFEELFGDPDRSYQAALDRHYSQGAPPGWQENYVSSYATMHPAEDWAETFAHYLHIRDTLDTAAAFAMAPAAATLSGRVPGDTGLAHLLELWLPLTWSLNMINRSMGHSDLYPFVLPPAVLHKMRLVHRLIAGG